MPFPFIGRGHGLPSALVLGGAGVLLAAVFLLVRLLVPEQDRSPGRRMIVHWLPIAVTALVATVLGHSEIGFGVIFGTSVAALSTVAGFIGISSPIGEAPAMARRVWPFLPVPAMLAFLLGMRGRLDLFDAAVLAMQGMLLLLIWPSAEERREDSAHQGEVWVGSTQELGVVGDARPTALSLALTVVEAGLVLALAGLGAWVLTRGAAMLSGLDVRYPTGVIAATLVSIALITPMISSGTAPAQAGEGWVALTAQAGVVLLNIGVLMPAVIVTAKVADLVHRASSAAAATQPAASLIYPRIAWRIDAVALVLFSLLFVPLGDGKVKLDRHLAGWLIVAYCVYLLLVMVMGVRA